MQSGSPLVSAQIASWPPRDTIYSWDAPGGGQRLIVSSLLIRDLVQQMQEAVAKVPRRGLEIGGLLLGQVRRERDTVIYEIVAFEEIPCEHRFGPSYILEDAGRARLSDALTRHQQEGAPPVVGFYRSYTGREAGLDDVDQSLLHAFFPRRRLACLLFRPDKEEVETSLQFWDSGSIVPKGDRDPFPFGAAQIVPDAPESHSEEPRERAPLEEYDELRQKPLEPSHRLPILPLFCCLLLGISCTSTYELWKLTREMPARVRFDAHPQGENLLLTWDSANPAVTASTRGVVAVAAGNLPFQIPLNAEQVRGGKLNFAPISDSTSLQLRLFNNRRETAEGFLRVIIAPSAIRNSTAAAPAAQLPADRDDFASKPPVARRQVQPELSPGIRSRIGADTQIPVLVTVDASGHVIHARSKITGHDGLERYLIDQALHAARQWTFSPARLRSGDPVPSDTTITFDFSPPAR